MLCTSSGTPRGDGWLTGCCSRSSTCWFAGYSAWPSWYAVRTWRRTLNYRCSGTRTRCCAATLAGYGTSRPIGCGSPRWHGSSPAGAGPKSSRLRPRHCWPGTAGLRGEDTTRAGGASPGGRRQSRASPASSFAGEGESAVGTPPDPRRTDETRHHHLMPQHHDLRVLDAWLRPSKSSQPNTRTVTKYSRRKTRTAIMPQPADRAKSQLRDPAPSSEAVQANPPESRA